MSGWLRRLRGVLGIGAVWGVAGAIAGGVGGVVAFLLGSMPLLPAVLELGMGAAGVGIVLGSAFAGVLTLAEGRRTLEQLTPARAALWGSVAGAGLIASWGVLMIATFGSMVPLSQLLPVIVSAVGSYGLLSGGLAAGTVALARRAPDELTVGSGSESLLEPPADG